MISTSSAIEQLRQWREDNVRNSDEICQLGRLILGNDAGLTNLNGSERWQVCEQVCIAALDCCQMGLAQQALNALNLKFPKSHRVQILNAMRYEAMCKFEAAEKLYMELLETDPANSVCLKRLVAIRKGEGDLPGAKKLLVDHVLKFQADQEAWLELSDMYVVEGDFTKATFCAEELILASPHNHLHFQRYADFKYSMGGLDNIEIARKYYAQALKLSSSNTRALIGFFLCAYQVALHSKSNQKQRKDNTTYLKWASSLLNEKYRKKAVVSISEHVRKFTTRAVMSTISSSI